MSTDTRTVITLRPMCLDDIDVLSRWFWSFEDIALFDRNMPIPMSIDALQEAWRARLAYRDPPRAFWFVAEDSAGAPAGLAGLHGVSYIHGDAVIPVFVGPHMRGRGLATAMAVAMLQLAFDRLRLFRLSTYYRADNAATRHVLTRLGFETEGRLREAWFAGGQRHDVVMTAIMCDEWQARRADLLPLLDTGDIVIRQRDGHGGGK